MFSIPLVFSEEFFFFFKDFIYFKDRASKQMSELAQAGVGAEGKGQARFHADTEP